MSARNADCARYPRTPFFKNGVSENGFSVFSNHCKMWKKWRVRKPRFSSGGCCTSFWFTKTEFHQVTTFGKTAFPNSQIRALGAGLGQPAGQAGLSLPGWPGWARRAGQPGLVRLVGLSVGLAWPGWLAVWRLWLVWLECLAGLAGRSRAYDRPG